MGCVHFTFMPMVYLHTIEKSNHFAKRGLIINADLSSRINPLPFNFDLDDLSAEAITLLVHHFQVRIGCVLVQNERTLC